MKVIEHYRHYYHGVTPLLPYIIISYRNGVTGNDIIINSTENTKNNEGKEIIKKPKNEKNISLCENQKSGNSGNSIPPNNEIDGNSVGNLGETEPVVVIPPTENNLNNSSFYETKKDGNSGNSGNSVPNDNEIRGDGDGNSGNSISTDKHGVVEASTVATVIDENREHIKNVIKSYEKTINDKRPLEGRDKQPFINWYFKQNGNSISASELWEIVEKEKAFTPETTPTPTPPVQSERSTITVEVCGEISEVVVE
jgi:hypothetical protein